MSKHFSTTFEENSSVPVYPPDIICRYRKNSLKEYNCTTGLIPYYVRLISELGLNNWDINIGSWDEIWVLFGEVTGDKVKQDWMNELQNRDPCRLGIHTYVFLCLVQTKKEGLGENKRFYNLAYWVFSYWMLLDLGLEESTDSTTCSWTWVNKVTEGKQAIERYIKRGSQKFTKFRKLTSKIHPEEIQDLPPCPAVVSFLQKKPS